MGGFLKVDYAEISLLGAREENQDRVTAAVAEHAALLVVIVATEYPMARPSGWERLCRTVPAATVSGVEPRRPRPGGRLVSRTKVN